MESTIRILAVDDSATIRKALQLILEPAGYQVEFGATGQEAVDKAHALHPAVMLLDFILPDFRGNEVCRRLAADPATADIPIVLVSTKGAEIRQAYHDLDNVVHYINKPFAPDEVTRTITEVLARSAERRLAKLGRSEDSSPLPETARGDTAEPRGRAYDEESRVFAEAWDDGERDVVESLNDEPEEQRRHTTRRETLEWTFESLRTGLEGVYVEEIDTPAGAAADEAQSYIDLASRLSRQLSEALDQAQSGVPYGLCSDGSIRSLDETLLDTYRRVCRLLFRAVGSGAVANDVVRYNRPRVLIVCRREGDSFALLNTFKQTASECHVFMITADVRQLPIMTRLYGPTHLVVDTAYGKAVWDQLNAVRALPEGQRLEIIAVTPDDNTSIPDVATTVPLGPNLVETLRRQLGFESYQQADEVPALAADA